MKIINLGSGSKGNATLVKLEEGYILIDCGLSRFEKLLNEHNISLDEIKYVFITHCHGDHVLNISKFSGDIIYCGEETISLPHNVLEPYETHEIGSFKVTPLKTSHDAPDSMGYLFNIDGSDLVYITDTGKIPAKTKYFLKNCRFYIFESNYEEELLMASSRPEVLKKRIKGTKGHLSNLQANLYLNEFIGENTKGFALAHISEECNDDSKIAANLEDFSTEIKTYLKQWESTTIIYDED